MSPASNRHLGKPAGSSVKLAPFSSAIFRRPTRCSRPVVNRLHVYKVAVTPGTRDYMDAMMALPAWQNWSAQAQAETWIIDKYEIA
jgi:glutathione S-transferase